MCLYVGLRAVIEKKFHDRHRTVRGIKAMFGGICGIAFGLGLLFYAVVVYVLLQKGIPGENKLVKGLVFGLCVWAVGMLPGMFLTYYFMTVAAGVVIYWTVLGLVEMPIIGLMIAAIYGE